MKSIETSVGRVIVVKLEPDEELIESLTRVINEYKIKSGLINIIGAFKQFTIGYYDLNSKDYTFQKGNRCTTKN